MPSTASGRIAKSRRQQKRTPHQKNHRWESFTTKISKLHSLDPLHRVRRHDLDAEDELATTSYLGHGLTRWGELNATTTFTTFRRAAAPMCESLAQIVHYDGALMDLLAENIGRHEPASLEPLLDLLTAFARDLGARFEAHFPRALALLVRLASRGPRDVDVVEWTFAALAFLFKYLSRLLAGDLRPTFDALAPLLGRERQPGHVVRFAAEAMSFLVKKAAAPARRQTALLSFVDHVRDDLVRREGTKGFDLYCDGVMAVFAEAIKGTGNTLHSTGAETFRALMRGIPDEEFASGRRGGVWDGVCRGVLTSVIHHSTEETFGGLVEVVAEEATLCAESIRQGGDPWRLAFSVRLMGVVAGVRKGSRVRDWPGLVQGLSSCLAAISKCSHDTLLGSPADAWELATNVAIVWNQASMDSLIPNISALMAAMTAEPLMRWYIPFCAYFADLNPERFRSLFLKPFQRSEFLRESLVVVGVLS